MRDPGRLLLVQTTHTRCRRCAHFRHPADFVGGPYGYCFHCYERHREQLRMFAGEIPAACQECRATVDQLTGETGSNDIRVRMEVHLKDGLYSLLCQPCGAKYAQLRLDLYGNTPFALAHDLK